VGRKRDLASTRQLRTLLAAGEELIPSLTVLSGPPELWPTMMRSSLGSIAMMSEPRQRKVHHLDPVDSSARRNSAVEESNRGNVRATCLTTRLVEQLMSAIHGLLDSLR
jgi:hypothetical protein